jgi:ubiquinone/menaquinone biosynthesis C-methylase UbiE
MREIDKAKKYQNLFYKQEVNLDKRLIYRVSKKFSFIEKLYFSLSRTALNKIDKIPNIERAKNILDIGCGTGITLKYITQFINKEARLHCIDLDKNPLLINDIKFKHCDIDKEQILYEDNFFDVVISTYVLEHLKNPYNLFSEVYRVLKPGGYFLCVTENYTSIFCPGSYNFYQDPTYVRPYNKGSLSKLAEMYNFEVIKIGYFRNLAYFVIMPFIPILEIFLKAKVFFIIWEAILGKSIYSILRKPCKNFYIS